MMKIAYSSAVAPDWGWETLVTKAAKYGFDGLALSGLKGQPHLPACPELSGDTDAARALLAEHKVELVCLAVPVALGTKKRSEFARQTAVITEFVELAAALRCPNLCVHAGEVGRWDRRESCLARIAHALRELAPIAARHNVMILVENGGDFRGSDDLWYLIDAVGHAAVGCCWSQCDALTIRERPTISLPRLGNRLGLVRVCDATIDPSGGLLEYKPLGEGDAEVARQVELLKGLVYRRYLTFDRPKLCRSESAEPDIILPQAAEWLRAKIDEKSAPLSAYKNDKNAPKLAPLATS